MNFPCNIIMCSMLWLKSIIVLLGVLFYLSFDAFKQAEFRFGRGISAPNPRLCCRIK